MKNIKDIFVFCIYARPNSPKTKRGANGKFLPKPLLFHLRHPNSKTNEPKFWQIFSPKNSFAKTSSALFRHLPEYLEGRTPKEKHPFLFQKKFHPRQIRNARSVFSFGVAEALRGSGGTIHSSLGFCSKYIRTLSRTYRQKMKSGSDAKIWSARSADTNAFPPRIPEFKRFFHAPRGSSFANTIL
ncbi:MAG: hypothetical protein KA007_02155 [Candidatus Pacebacteria bacterium]|nr:hypothetical protein [Candidatus Paceibacterota bacterium]